MKTQTMTPEQIRSLGLKALAETLGPVGWCASCSSSRSVTVTMWKSDRNGSARKGWEHWPSGSGTLDRDDRSSHSIRRDI